MPLPQLTDAEHAAAEAHANFSTRFFAEVNSKYTGRNVATSPFSASMLLSLLANGCNELTRTQICELLGCKDIETANILSKKYNAWLPGIDDNVTINIANSLWYRNKYTVNPAFADIAADSYAAELYARDFNKNDALIGEINSWTKRKTISLIEKILDFIPPELHAIQINTLYFKGSWSDCFSEEATVKADFHASTGTQKVDMMNIASHSFDYAKTDSYEIVEMPYGTRRNICMTVILPAPGIDIDEFIASENFKAAATTATKNKFVHLSIPKFKIEPSDKIELTETLVKLGVNNLTQMQDCTFFKESLNLIFRVYQKVSINVDENGTEAAAVTWTYYDGATGATFDPIRVEVNRPFIFLIREKVGGLTLFAGKVSNI